MTWGYGASGVLGHGDLDSVTNPTFVEGLIDIVYCEAGAYHNMVVQSSGKVFAWGRSDAN